MRIDWRFFGVSVAGLALLAGCERQPEPTSYKLDGTWAWGGETNCYGNENTIVFDGSRIQVFLHGDLTVSVADAKIEQKDHEGKPLIEVRYKLESPESSKLRDFEEEYLAVDDNTLLPVETEVNGTRQLPAAGSGKRLVRCPADALTPVE